MWKKSQQYLTSFKDRLHISNARGYEFRNDLSFASEEQKEIRRPFTEFKFDIIALYVSCIVVCSKLILINRSVVEKFYTHGRTYLATSSLGTYRLLSDDSKRKISELLLTSNNVMKELLENGVSWMLCPLIAGLGMTFLTWYVIYTDSCIPGLKPPTPFSPTKNRRRRSPRFHSAYIIAIVNGVLLFLLMTFSSI